MVLTITTGGMREFVFYTGDGHWAQGVIAGVRGAVTAHELQSYTVRDDEWDVYKQFKL